MKKDKDAERVKKVSGSTARSQTQEIVAAARKKAVETGLAVLASECIEAEIAAMRKARAQRTLSHTR